MLGNRSLRNRFHEKIWDAIENHFDFDDGFEVPIDSYEILRKFGEYLMKIAYNDEFAKEADEMMENDEE